MQCTVAVTYFVAACCAITCSTWSGVSQNFASLAEALTFSFLIHLVSPSVSSLLRSFIQRFITFGYFLPDLLVFLWGFWCECSGFPDWFLDGIVPGEWNKYYLIYFARYANALLASAILCVSSFFFTAFHWFEYAASTSSESLSAIAFPFFPLAKSIIHLHA